MLANYFEWIVTLEFKLDYEFTTLQLHFWDWALPLTSAGFIAYYLENKSTNILNFKIRMNIFYSSKDKLYVTNNVY